MKIKLFCALVMALACVPRYAKADSFQFKFGGGGVSGAITLTYGTATDARYTQAYEVTGISGSFSDTNIGITNAAITGLESLNRSIPEPGNLLTPNDFSRYPVAAGTAHGSLSYDNLLYPGGSPQTATTYPFHGGFLDIYGLLFDIGGGRVVDFWSNGVLPGTNFVDYGAIVATKQVQLDAVDNGVAVTPEPGTVWLLGTGLAGTLAGLKRRRG